MARKTRYLTLRYWDSSLIQEAIDVGLTLEDGRVFHLLEASDGSHVPHETLRAEYEARLAARAAFVAEIDAVEDAASL
jgi:hypothetical protein